MPIDSSTIKNADEIIVLTDEGIQERVPTTNLLAKMDFTLIYTTW